MQRRHSTQQHSFVYEYQGLFMSCVLSQQKLLIQLIIDENPSDIIGKRLYSFYFKSYVFYHYMIQKDLNQRLPQFQTYHRLYDQLQIRHKRKQIKLNKKGSFTIKTSDLDRKQIQKEFLLNKMEQKTDQFICLEKFTKYCEEKKLKCQRELNTKRQLIQKENTQKFEQYLKKQTQQKKEYNAIKEKINQLKQTNETLKKKEQENNNKIEQLQNQLRNISQQADGPAVSNLARSGIETHAISSNNIIGEELQRFSQVSQSISKVQGIQQLLKNKNESQNQQERKQQRKEDELGKKVYYDSQNKIKKYPNLIKKENSQPLFSQSEPQQSKSQQRFRSRQKNNHYQKRQAKTRVITVSTQRKITQLLVSLDQIQKAQIKQITNQILKGHLQHVLQKFSKKERKYIKQEINKILQNQEQQIRQKRTNTAKEQTEKSIIKSSIGQMKPQQQEQDEKKIQIKHFIDNQEGKIQKVLIRKQENYLKTKQRILNQLIQKQLILKNIVQQDKEGYKKYYNTTQDQFSDLLSLSFHFSNNVEEQVKFSQMEQNSLQILQQFNGNLQFIKLKLNFKICVYYEGLPYFFKIQNFCSIRNLRQILIQNSKFNLLDQKYSVYKAR